MGKPLGEVHRELLAEGVFVAVGLVGGVGPGERQLGGGLTAGPGRGTALWIVGVMYRHGLLRSSGTANPLRLDTFKTGERRR